MQPSDLRRIFEISSTEPTLSAGLRRLAQDRGLPLEFQTTQGVVPEGLGPNDAALVGSKNDFNRCVQLLHALSGGRVFIGAPILCRGHSQSSLVLWPHEARVVLRSLEWTETSVLEAPSLDALSLFSRRIAQDRGLRWVFVKTGATDKEAYCLEFFSAHVGSQVFALSLEECVQEIMGGAPGRSIPSVFVASHETGLLLASLARSEARLAWGDRNAAVAWMNNESSSHLALGWVLDHLGLVREASKILGGEDR